jgi:hypothetical protein
MVRLGFFQISVILCIYIVTTSCQTSHTRRFARSLHTLKDESMAILPGDELNHPTLSSIPKQLVNITRTDIEHCTAPRSNLFLTGRSTCPWKFVLNNDQNRIPKEIYEAKCRTETCLGTNIQGCTTQKCREVQYFTWVKRRASRQRYHRVLEPISVGCTCTCDRIRNSRRSTMCSWNYLL